jgi:hypothetical protein
MNTYELTEQIRKAETVKDGEAILIEWLGPLAVELDNFADVCKMVVDNFDPIDDPREYGVGL